MQIRNAYSVYLPFTLVCIFFIIIAVSPSFAGSKFQSVSDSFLVLSPDKQFDYAQELFSTQDYLTAISEYKQFIHFFPEDERVELAMFQIGMAYYLDKHFTDAVSAFKRLTEKYYKTEYSIKSYFKISEAYTNLNAFDLAIINLNNLVTITQDEDIRDEAFYRMGWIYIETASWDEARRSFSNISFQNKHKYKLEKLAAELDKEALIPRKNPNLAGFLSILPGAGYLYCERYQDALVAFLLNGGLIYAAFESFDEEHYALGGVITFVGFGFYAGNIYGAVSSAHKFNRKKTSQFIHKLKNNSQINLSADLEKKGICLSFRFAF